MPRLGLITQGADPRANAYAVAVANGLSYAVRELNAAGGMLGERVDLIVQQDGGHPEASAEAARRLIGAKVCFAISLSHTLATMAAQQVTSEARVPHLAPCQSGNRLTSDLDNRFFWHTGPSSTVQV